MLEYVRSYCSVQHPASCCFRQKLVAFCCLWFSAVQGAISISGLAALHGDLLWQCGSVNCSVQSSDSCRAESVVQCNTSFWCYCCQHLVDLKAFVAFGLSVQCVRCRSAARPCSVQVQFSTLVTFLVFQVSLDAMQLIPALEQ